VCCSDFVVCCSVLQCVAETAAVYAVVCDAVVVAVSCGGCCSTLQLQFQSASVLFSFFLSKYLCMCACVDNTPQHHATHCNTQPHAATHCNTRQHTATHCNTLQPTATHCNTLQHTATHCNTLQHTAKHIATQFNTHCNTL